MEKREKILSENSLKLIIAVLVILSFVLTLTTAGAVTRLKAARLRTAEAQARCIDLASDELSNLSGDLVKAMYAGTPPKLAMIASRMAKESAAAKAALSWLPAGEMPMENTGRFLSQAGDYALYLSRKFSSGQMLTPQERENLSSLREYADRLAVSMDRFACDGASQSPQEEALPTDFLHGMEQGFSGYPTLIYDGPFSDHLISSRPKLTGEIISREEAEKAAHRICKAPLPDFREENSKLPCYVFHDGKAHSVAITKHGGRLCYYITAKPDTASAKNLSREQAVFAAQKYLDQNGYSSMKDTYTQVTDGVMTINFAYYDAQAQVLCYTDLIKVQVDLSDGEILGLDARGFLSNHSDRQFPAPKLSLEEARASVSPALTVENHRLALIPTSGKYEQLSYEFLCTSDTGDKVLSYINANTGEEAELLLLIDTEGGSLTK